MPRKQPLIRYEKAVGRTDFVGFTVTPAVNRALTNLSLRRRYSKGKIVREALDDYLAKVGER